MSEQPHITFTAVSGPKSFQTLACLLGDEPFTIGRGSGATLVLADPSVSRTHASIGVEAGRVIVQDCGSSGGTSVNMMRLDKDESVRLRDRDLLLMGPWKILIRIEGDAPADSVADEPADSKAADTSASGDVKGGKGDPLYATRASIFLKLKAGATLDRELGWNEFADKYSRIIAGFARNAGLPAQEADDVLQDVLMGFFRVSDRFEYDPKKGRFRGYLKRVTLNAIRARHRKKRPTTGFDDTVDPPAESDLDAAWDRQWTEQLLQRAMGEARNEVEERTWQSFELYGVRGVPAEEVAKETGMTPAAIRHAKMRLTRRVREIVERLRDDEG
ncbi:MAG: sigma-70 family RNA polymerase sigma factor [Phycisphaerae bacterium]|nr:sigma-70 family RNA polymerase sigma factor [Phycisphaerae bacterium]MBT5584075.1 sigma-70 family RNA polymerase sigma factor [Phycisphaerae bacterium]